MTKVWLTRALSVLRMGIWRSLLIGLAVWLALSAFAKTQFGHSWDTSGARRLEFMVRRAVGKEPALASNLRIFLYDDATVANVEAEDLALSDWADVIHEAQKAEAAVVLVDKSFGTSSAREHAETFLETLRSQATPVAVPIFLTPDEVVGRTPLKTDTADFAVQSYIKDPSIKDPSNLEPQFFQRFLTDDIAYGPNDRIRSAFARLGHVTYDGKGRTVPFITSTDLTHAIPHLALQAALEVQVADNKIAVNGSNFPLDCDGNILVNLISAEALQTSTQVWSLGSLLARVQGKVDHADIEKGDVVLLLPSMFTGHTDWVPSPLGQIPGGFVVAALVNSILQNEYLHPYGTNFASTALGAILAATLAATLPAGLFVATWLFLLAGIIGAALAAFTYFGLVTPWLFGALAFAFAGAIAFADRLHLVDRSGRALRATLQGAVSPRRLEQILENPNSIDFAPRQRTVTVMFIDIVGFSLTSERQNASELFQSLSEILSDLARQVHDHGGVVDKVLGDGLLCFFGYEYGAALANDAHPVAAVQCGVTIQTGNLQRNLNARAQGKPVFPLRIGINTTPAFIGDLGGTRRLEPTIIGPGVNLAKRLETACDSYRLMISQSTRQNLGAYESSLSLNMRLIKIKHFTDLLEAYEVDPFPGQSRLREKAAAEFRAHLGIDRADRRVGLPRSAHIPITCDHGRGWIFNHSRSGFAIMLDCYLGVGVHVSLMFPDAAPGLQDGLSSVGIRSIICEVRWGEPADGSTPGFAHGLQIVNLDEGQKNGLFESIQAASVDPVSGEPVNPEQKPA